MSGTTNSGATTVSECAAGPFLIHQVRSDFVSLHLVLTMFALHLLGMMTSSAFLLLAKGHQKLALPACCCMSWAWPIVLETAACLGLSHSTESSKLQLSLVLFLALTSGVPSLPHVGVPFSYGSAQHKPGHECYPPTLYMISMGNSIHAR